MEVTNILRDIKEGRLNSLKTTDWHLLRYSKSGDTILHIAARLGLLDTVEECLRRDTNHADCKNRDFKTPLHEASQFSQYDVLKVLLAHGADPNALKRADWTPLMLACTKCTERSYSCVAILLESGSLVNYENKDGWTALHLISREGDVRILKLLLSHGVDVSKLTKNKRSALHIAGLHGHLSVAQELVALGLDVNARDSCGNTPVHEAVLGGHVNVCHFFAAQGDFTVKNKADFGILHLAASVGGLSAIEYLINVIKVDVNVCNRTNLTPLHCAARKKQKGAFDLLIELGANDKIKDDFGRCATEYFCIGS